jgi:adenine-specific DNA methylase
MIPRECKRLAEVEFPIATVGRHSLAEKARRMGTPNQLHLWWAWRPLAACRAMLLALLLPDPCDPQCPSSFKEEAHRILARLRTIQPDDAALRDALLRFLAEFAAWEFANHSLYLALSRDLVRAAYPGDAPLVVDPFSGGGAIPLEAQRLGCEVGASDLNPVAATIIRTKLEAIPRHGASVGDDLRQAGRRLFEKARAALGDVYRRDKDGNGPIAYIWARTVRCEAPRCGAEIPLIRSFWLSTKAGRKWAVRPVLPSHSSRTAEITFEVFQPRAASEVRAATVQRARATCLVCNTVLPADRVRDQLRELRGGGEIQFGASGRRTGGARLLAVAYVKDGVPGRFYRPPSPVDYEGLVRARDLFAKLQADGGPGMVPDERLPPRGTLGFRVQLYGMESWGDLFTTRQKLALGVLATLIRRMVSDAEVPQTLAPLLAMVCSKLADRCNSIVNWSTGVECPNQIFKGNAIPMGWDFAESNILCDSSGSILQTIDSIARNAEATFIPGASPVAPTVADAAKSLLPDDSAAVWFTDPPYYDSVPYADLSDFFYVWLKRALPPGLVPVDPFDPANPLTPKVREAVQDESKVVDGRRKDRSFFESAMAAAFREGGRILREDGIGCVVFAHKTTEGWEALLSGLIKGNWVITASWPIATERAARVRARDSAALATSVHLVCRPRSEDASVGDWGDVLRELPHRVGDWMEHLQREGVRGADLVFACIGPAIEIYSRYSKVVDAQEREIPLGGDPEATEPHERGFLAYVWEVIGRLALEQILGTAEARARNGAAGALEEDARLTALFLWTLQATEGGTNGNGSDDVAGDSDEEESEDEAEDEDEDEGTSTRGRKAKKGFSLVFDVVRRFAQPLGIHLSEWEGRIIATEKGVVRLLPVSERAQQLFGEGGASAVADRLEQAREPRTVQLSLFTDDTPPAARGRGGRRRGVAVDVPDTDLRTRRQATTLDRVHAAMLLQAAGRANALRALLQAEVERGPDFVRLANSLSALYPRDSEEKRLVDAMLLAVPR